MLSKFMVIPNLRWKRSLKPVIRLNFLDTKTLNYRNPFHSELRYLKISHCSKNLSPPEKRLRFYWRWGVPIKY